MVSSNLAWVYDLYLIQLLKKYCNIVCYNGNDIFVVPMLNNVGQVGMGSRPGLCKTKLLSKSSL